MQAVVVAVIGTLGVVIPSLLSLGNAHGRRLRRIKDEAEMFKAIPADLIEERQLARYVLNESMWEYAVARHNPANVLRFATIGLLTTSVATVGVQFLILGDIEDFYSPRDVSTGAFRLIGFGLLLLGTTAYLRNLRAPIDAIRHRVMRLDGPPARMRQLIALEAMKTQGATLEASSAGEPNDPKPATSTHRFLLKLMGGSPWDDLDEHLATRSGSTPDATGGTIATDGSA